MRASGDPDPANGNEQEDNDDDKSEQGLPKLVARSNMDDDNNGDASDEGKNKRAAEAMVYYHDPYETDTDQSIGTEDDNDDNQSIDNVAQMTTDFGKDIEDEVVNKIINDQINHELAWRAAMQLFAAEEKLEVNKDGDKEVNLVKAPLTLSEAMKDPDIWIGDTGATAHTTKIDVPTTQRL